MSDFNDIEVRSGFPRTALEDRLISRFYSPGSIKGASIAVVEQEETTGTLSTSIPNGSSATFVVASATAYGNNVMGDCECTIYIGSVDYTNILPGGASVNASDYIVNGPINTPYDVNGTESFAMSNYITRVQVRNNSGSSKTVIVVIKLRYIADAGDYIE